VRAHSDDAPYKVKCQVRLRSAGSCRPPPPAISTSATSVMSRRSPARQNNSASRSSPCSGAPRPRRRAPHRAEGDRDSDAGRLKGTKLAIRRAVRPTDGAARAQERGLTPRTSGVLSPAAGPSAVKLRKVDAWSDLEPAVGIDGKGRLPGSSRRCSADRPGQQLLRATDKSLKDPNSRAALGTPQSRRADPQWPTASRRVTPSHRERDGRLPGGRADDRRLPTHSRSSGAARRCQVPQELSDEFFEAGENHQEVDITTSHDHLLTRRLRRTKR